MCELIPDFGILTTFRILVDQDQEVLRDKLHSGGAAKRTILIVPLLASEYTISENLPVFENILNQLAQVQYLHTIIFGLDQADEADANFLRELLIKHEIPNWIIQWNDGPVFSRIYQMLHSKEMVTLAPGKGKNIFLSFGLCLAMKAKAVALLDADIRSFDAIQLDRLLYPVIVHNYDFSKAYYTRISDGQLYGRVKRLLVTPLLLALKAKFVAPKDRRLLELIEYLLQFNYPLSGEVAFGANVLGKLRFATNWGAEMFTLTEIYRKGVSAAQVEFATEPFEHKHQPACEHDPQRGLNKMAVDIVTTLIHTLTRNEGLEITDSFFTDLHLIFNDMLEKLTKSYADESAFNHLTYDRDDEVQLAERVFAKSILRAGEIFADRTAEVKNLLRLVYRYPHHKSSAWSAYSESIFDVSTSSQSGVIEDHVTHSWEQILQQLPQVFGVLLAAMEKERFRFSQLDHTEERLAS
jgi:glucosyl-3-phosphoglycerate synthase